MIKITEDEQKVLDIFKPGEELDMVDINRRLPDKNFTNELQSLLAAGLVKKVFRLKKND